MSAVWIVERTASRRLPYRASIEQHGRLILAVRAQARWPGPGQQIFCLREHGTLLTCDESLLDWARAHKHVRAIDGRP